MSEYWWDRSGSDRDLERLEALLGQLAFSGSPRAAVPPRSRVWRRRAVVWALWAAALAIASFAGFRFVRSPPAWEVYALAGMPTLQDQPISSTGQWKPGAVLETGLDARAKVLVGRIGEIDVEPGSRLRLVRTDREQHRVALERGGLRAFIWAPPRRFFVETREALAVDLGCAYSLHVEDSGAGRLRVAFGWVSFFSESTDSEVYVPAGATCLLRPGRGAGTPYFEDASEGFRAALEQLDVATDPSAALDALLAEARKKDALTLLQILHRLVPPDRVRVCGRLGVLLPGVPADCEAVARGDGHAVEPFWQALGLGGLKWWEIGRLPGPPNRP